MFGLGMLSLILFIVIVTVVSVEFKRTCAEGMFVAWICVLLLSGSKLPEVAPASIKAGFTAGVVFPTMAFCVMSTLMQKTGIITRLVQIFNSLFGRIRGGAGYVSTAASALMGMVSGSGPGNAAVSGTITIPWMIESGFSKELATTIVAGNATLGASIPPSTVMFMLLAMPIVAGNCETSELYMTCLCGGLYLVVWRMLTVFYFTRKYNIQKVDASYIHPLSETLSKGWRSLFIFVSILIPLVLTTGPVSAKLKAISSIGAKGIKSIDMMVWIPVLLILVTIIEGWKHLPHSLEGWLDLIRNDVKTYSNVGGTLIFALCGGAVMTKLGMAKEAQMLFAALGNNVSQVVVLAVVGGVIMLAAGPMSTTATLAALGSVAYAALTATGMRPSVALTCIIIFGAVEGSMPPSSSPLFIAAGIARLDNPIVCFKNLVKFYVSGSAVLAMLIGMGILPVL